MMKGRAQFQAKLAKLANVGALADKVVFVAADMIKAEAQNSITRGAVSGKGHVASAPGAPPKNDTGVLKSHIEAVHTGPGQAEVRSEAPYASDLEFGTSKMSARPYMRPARDKSMPAIKTMIAKELGDHVRKSGG